MWTENITVTATASRHITLIAIGVVQCYIIEYIPEESFSSGAGTCK